jgi:hypothetical protein
MLRISEWEVCFWYMRTNGRDEANSNVFETIVTNLQRWVTHEDNEFHNKMYRDKFFNRAALSVTCICWALNWSPQCLVCKSERRERLGMESDLGFQLRVVWYWSRDSWPPKIRLIGYPKPSAKNYHSSLRNNPEDGISQAILNTDDT